MKVSENIYRRLGRLAGAGLLGAALVAGVSVTPAEAQSYGYNNYRSWRAQRNDVIRIGQANGYNEGFESGLADRSRGGRMSWQSQREYQSATLGYRPEWGLMSVYQQAFRQAYAQGYQDAYNARVRNRRYDRDVIVRQYSRYGYDPYFGTNSYRTAPARIATNEIAQRAANQGFEDGFTRGQYDRSIGVRRPNPQGHGAFQHGLNGWNPEWGGAGYYQQYYRQYFMQGYEQGFAGRRSGFTFRLR